MVTHIVLFKLIDPSSENTLAVKEMLLSMSGKISFLMDLEVGVDIVRSERSYDLALITRFASLADLNAYQGHPYHAETVIPFVKKVISSSVVVDYEI